MKEATKVRMKLCLCCQNVLILTKNVGVILIGKTSAIMISRRTLEKSAISGQIPLIEELKCYVDDNVD